MATTIKLVDNTEISAEDAYGQVDDVFEYTSYCEDYSKLSEISKKLTDENMKKVVVTDSYNNAMTYTNMTCAEPKISIIKDDVKVEYVIRIKAKTEQDKAVEAITVAIQKFDDDDALSVKTLYPQFETLIGRTLEKDFKLVYYNILYKTAQTTVVSEQYKPGDKGTESIYTRLDEDHAGTKEDPIPYYGNQILEKGKIYEDQEGTLWICINGSGIAVFDQLINLPAFVAQYSDAEGTPEDPIVYAGRIALETGKYYTQNGVIYECIRDSEIPVYDDLSAMVDNYVKEYNPTPVGPVGPGGGEDVPTEDGTKEHPYTYSSGMKIYNGSYYKQDDVLYVGTRDSENPVYQNLSDLVGLYVEVVEDEEEETPTPTEPEEGEDEKEPTEPGKDEEEEGSDESTQDGSFENPIKYNNSMELKNGKYYTQNGVIYLCNRSTGIPVYQDLEDLVDIYVQVVSEPKA